MVLFKTRADVGKASRARLSDSTKFLHDHARHTAEWIPPRVPSPPEIPRRSR